MVEEWRVVDVMTRRHPFVPSPDDLDHAPLGDARVEKVNWCPDLSAFGTTACRSDAEAESPAAAQKYWSLVRMASIRVKSARWVACPVRSERLSERQLAFRWYPRRPGEVQRCPVPAEMIENPLDDIRFLDARDHPQLSAAAPTPLDLDLKDSLETLRAGHGAMAPDPGLFRWHLAGAAFALGNHLSRRLLCGANTP